MSLCSVSVGLAVGWCAPPPPAAPAATKGVALPGGRAHRGHTRTTGRRLESVRCAARRDAGGAFDAGGLLGSALKGGGIEADPAVAALSEYLKALGITNRAELMQTVDICMNPNSLYRVALPGPRSDTRGAPNRMARRLDLESDVKPVVEVLLAYGLEEQEVGKVILAFPPVLCYPKERVESLLQYLEEVGVPKPVAKIFTKRPTLVGLRADENLRKIVGYFKANDYTTEKIVEMLETSV